MTGFFEMRFFLVRHNAGMMHVSVTTEATMYHFLTQLSGTAEKHFPFLRIQKCKSHRDASRLSNAGGPVTTDVNTKLSLAMGITELPYS
jgi:hypothetical protein